ncbi:PcfJ domain-containing protein [uncultured Flavonifractor sp.]|uniref:PcfJ domain-containing protein n=1 Tax=uncultured Flavonifractor sp. TaxID=1193534 RepID=UPI002613A6D1|nr:PcfJ domain-containing protein [uncultured Flavonifractor sp.]
MSKYTDREQELLDGWPTVTAEDLTRMNDLFPHYLFFRKEGDLMGLGGVRLYTSCCGHKEYRPYLLRTETPEHRDLLDHLKHKESWTCPWCGRTVTVIDLAKARKRKALRRVELTVLLHVQGDALCADALALWKDYADEADLTARPTAWCSSGYRFTQGEVMQVDHQWDDKHPCITYERDKLGRRKLVQEPFKFGSLSWYRYEAYSILNREALEGHPLFRYCGYFDLWQYRPMGPRGYAARFHDFISYLTAYAIYPRQVEMLAKAGYWEPLNDLIYSRKKNAAAMCWEEPDPRKSFRLNKRELSLLMGMQPPIKTLEVRNYVGRHWGETWSLPFCMDFCNLWGNHLDPMEVLRFLNRYRLDPDRFLRYLGGEFDRDHIEAVYYADLFEIYRDYLNGAYQLGYCLEHSRVLWPPELFTAHDLTMEQLAQRQEVSQAQNRRARRLKYEFELDGWKIVFPATAAAIKREGKMLDHCVGGYADRHMRGVTTILFLRRSSAPSTPYVTIEMDGNQIRQIHGYHNDTLPDSPKPREVHKVFLDTWLRWLRAGSKRNEDGTPKLPKRAGTGKAEQKGVGAA